MPIYADIITTLQARIDDRVYPVGDLLPSEAKLAREFSTSRSTVVRALDHLRQHGWVDAVQGKGRIVLGHPASGMSTLPRRLQLLLQADRHAPLLSARRVPATARIAAALACPPGEPLVARRYLLSLPGGAPFGVSTLYAPADTPSHGAFLPHLERTRGVTAHRVVERLGARHATEAEAMALGLDGRRCVAVTLLTVLDAADRPLLAVDAVISRDAKELVSSYVLA